MNIQKIIRKLKKRKMQCVLHIGTEKTGTTLLQEWLYANQEELSGQRIYLSESLAKPNNRLLVSYFHSGLDNWARTNNITNEEEKRCYFDGFEEAFAEEIERARHEHDAIIITSEHFHSRLQTEKEILRLKKYLLSHFDSVRVVCYFREQGDMARSYYSTILRDDYVSTLEQFLTEVSPANYYYNHKAIADNWSKVFGKENCEFRIYDRKLFIDQDLRKDFLTALGVDVDPGKLDYTVDFRNRSLSKMEGELYRCVNEVVPFWKESGAGVNGLNLKIKKTISSIDELKKGIIKIEKPNEVSERFYEVNRQFFDDYFNGDYLFVLPEEERQEGGDQYLHVNTIVSILTDMISNLAQKIHVDVLQDSDADWLRDMALKYDRQEKLVLEDAINLMALARKARPHGPVINNKLEQYRNKLKNRKCADVDRD